MNFIFPPWARVTLMVLVFAAGFWTRGSIEARHEVHELKQQVQQGAKVDKAVADKIHDEARADAQLGAAKRKNQEAARHDPTYREYLDAELPDAARQFLHDAESADPSPDGADPRL